MDEPRPADATDASAPSDPAATSALRAECEDLRLRVRGLEDALAQAQTRFELFAATLPGISWETWGKPHEATVNYVSASAAAITGYSVDEWQSRPGFVLELIHPDDRARVVAETDASYARGDVRGAQDYRAITRDGRTIWLHVRYTILRDETGAAFAWQAFSLDVTAQRAAEVERDRMRDELLDELSTPLIPISDDVLAMPLIGRIDRSRAGRVLQVLLAGLSRARARFAILDITGVRDCDAEVARALVQSARAARLLGVEALITGLRPEVARAFVELGEDLAGVVTLATLQAGVAHALRRGARR